MPGIHTEEPGGPRVIPVFMFDFAENEEPLLLDGHLQVSRGGGGGGLGRRDIGREEGGREGYREDHQWASLITLPRNCSEGVWEGRDGAQGSKGAVDRQKIKLFNVMSKRA